MIQELRKHILFEAHETRYSVHPGAIKMYKDLREHFWWNGMKRDVAKNVSKCLTCQKVKRLTGELQPIKIPKRKWEQITMDFVIGLPRTSE